MNTQICIADIISATQGRILSEVETKFSSVGTDTRKSLSGKLFVALAGENYDAHDFLNQAIEAGASGLLVHRWNESDNLTNKKVTVILVENTLTALQQLSKLRRAQWGKPIIAITGSNGKTTTKEFTAQILSLYKKVHYNQGSFNNHWGLPLTLLDLKPDHDIAICEMGMNHSGEIQTLVEIAQPNIVGVTMVGRAHLEGLGSIEAVAKAKEEIYFTKNNNITTGIFNMDNHWTKLMKSKFISASTRTLTFSSIDSKNDVYFNIEKMNFDELIIRGHIQGISGRTNVPIFGLQNLTNLMFASCVGLAVGLSPEQIWKSLSLCTTTWGRNQRLIHPSGTEILFDGYNANPDSQAALIENLKAMNTNRPIIGVFGEMRELGSHSAKLHEELGSLVSTFNFTDIYFVGNFGEDFKRGLNRKNENKHFLNFKNYSEVNSFLIDSLKSHFETKPIITVKGSRGVKLEKILKELALIN